MVNRTTLLHGMLAAVIPPACLLCNRVFQTPGILCPECSDDLTVIANPCDRCGMPMMSAMCGDCLRAPPLFDRVVIAYGYRYPTADLIREMKYRQRLIVARMLGDALAEAVILSKTAGNHPLPECIIPVPLHRGRLIKRGFNQSLEMARVIAKRLDIALNYRLIRKIRATTPQFELAPAARHRNVKGAFALTRPLEYNAVAIVDDVITTGATINEMTRLLKKAGVKVVEAWAAARTV